MGRTVHCTRCILPHFSLLRTRENPAPPRSNTAICSRTSLSYHSTAHERWSKRPQHQKARQGLACTAALCGASRITEAYSDSWPSQADLDSWPSQLSESALRVTVAQIPTRHPAPTKRLRPRPRRAPGGPVRTAALSCQAPAGASEAEGPCITSEVGGPGGAAGSRGHTCHLRRPSRITVDVTPQTGDSPIGSLPGGPAPLGSDSSRP